MSRIFLPLIISLCVIPLTSAQHRGAEYFYDAAQRRYASYIKTDTLDYLDFDEVIAAMEQADIARQIASIVPLYDSRLLDKSLMSPLARSRFLESANFSRPVPGQINSGFGYRPRFGRLHKGIDLHLNIGDTVRAAFKGIISHIGYQEKGYGTYIVIKHPDNVETRYAHLDRPLLPVGSQVITGQPIALGGNSGHSTGPHLHFEVRADGKPLDPAVLCRNTPTDPGMPDREVWFGILDFISNVTPEADPHDPLAPDVPSQLSYYTVRKGDTPAYIAWKTGLPLRTLCRINNIDRHTPLFVGRRLRLQ